MTNTPNPEAPRLRVGVLGAARITPKALIDPSVNTGAFDVVRVAARDRARAEAFAAEQGIAAVSDSYAELIAADDVDVVYNPLPMSLHAEWTIAALRAGKHVLCEKPFASNAFEAQQMVDAAEETQMVLGEAFHYWYHPVFQQVLSLVDAGVIGDLTNLNAAFDIAIPKPDIRWDFSTSGGSTMDLGCYPIHWVRSVVGTEPTVTAATAQVDGLIDASLQADLTFASSRRSGGPIAASIQSSMVHSGPGEIRLDIQGTQGAIAVVNPLAPQAGNTLTVTTAAGTTSGQVDAGNTYAHMVRAFADHVIHGSPYPTQGADSVANMAVIDACYAAAGLPRRGEAAS